MAEFRDLATKLLQNIIRKQTAIKSPDGEANGVLTEGSQNIGGTVGGSGEGGGTPTSGDEEGRGVEEDTTGDIPIERVRRRLRGGIKINFDEQPKNLSEGWIDPSTQSITINIAHPAWKVADGLTLNAGVEHVRVYHLIRTVFTVMVEEANIENPKKMVADLLSKWYDRQIGGS